VAGGHAAGGSAGLAELIDQHGEYIYRDLHEYAGGLNLVDALRDGSGYSPRQIITLIRGLPLESATVASLRGGQQFRGWSTGQYLDAQIVDAVRENTYATIVMGGPKRKPREPEPIYRPDTEEKRKKGNIFVAMANQVYQEALKQTEE
jgi:hypothetical protein